MDDFALMFMLGNTPLSLLDSGKNVGFQNVFQAQKKQEERGDQLAHK